MSLLKPTQNDYDDAHGASDQVPIFQQIRDALRFNKPYWQFESVPGFFHQDDPSTDDLVFNYATADFGRLKPWSTIVSELEELNRSAPPNVAYKLLFNARHGQGYHNAGVEKYGIDEWNRKWCHMTGDGEVLWGPDPMLTELGINQAKENNAAWKKQISDGAPVPSKFYVSPLQRSCHTLVYTWAGIKSTEIKPRVMEILRETMGVSLCDKRLPKSVVDERFKKHGFITDGLSEQDDLHSETRETLWEQSLRVDEFLQDLFNEDLDGDSVDKRKSVAHTFILTTTHAGTIRGFITALGHRQFTISTGGMIPCVVKATRVET